MDRLRKLTLRQWLIVAHDIIATALAVSFTFALRFEGRALHEYVAGFRNWVPEFLLWACIVYFVFGLHKSKWRFTSLPELLRIVQAATVMALSLLIIDYFLVAPNVYGKFYFGKITIFLYWFVQIACLAGLRVVYRYFRYTRTLRHANASQALRAIVAGAAADVEVLLRAIESGAVKKLSPVGILSSSSADQGQSVRGVPVLGQFEDLEPVYQDLAKRGRSATRLVLTPSAFEAAHLDTMLMRARRLGLATSRLPSLDDGMATPRLAPVAVEDLLLRPSVKIEYERLASFLKEKSIVVTGGGGSIGSEICNRITSFGAQRLLIIENSEPALYAVLEQTAAKNAVTHVEGRLADVRDRERMVQLLSEFRPDLVFHAAALKHVPLLEANWSEGIKTNVFGSVNVADATAIAGAQALVLISTDKAIEPVSILGATKRLAEMYCQALDRDRQDTIKQGLPAARCISVRFGNVLASTGSVVPKFKAQIEAGGPVTVTHPDMVRYFMTIREACDLVVCAASHALGPGPNDTSIYCLNMGQPVKIVELAERMIRLAGLEPGHDIDIVFSGMRPGERLNEILFSRDEANSETGIPGIVAARPANPGLQTIQSWLTTLDNALIRGEKQAIYDVLEKVVPDFRGKAA